MRKKQKAGLLFMAFLMSIICNLLSPASFVSYASQDADISAPQQDNAKILREDVSKRAREEKHFLRSDGSYEAINYGYAVHRETEDGWKEIDNTLIKKGGAYVNQDSEFITRFMLDASSEKLVNLEFSGYSFSWGLTFDKSGQKLNPAKSNAKVIAQDTSYMSDDEIEVNAMKTQSSIMYENVFGDGVNVQYTVLPDKLVEDVIIEQPGTGFSGYTMNVFAKGMLAKADSASAVYFVSLDTEETAMTFEAPVMYDAAGESSADIKTSVTQTEKGWAVTYLPNTEWLTAESRKYPITIDPTVTTLNTTSTVYDNYRASNGTIGSSSATTMTVGNNSSGTNSCFWRIATLPTIANPSQIFEATFRIRVNTNTVTGGSLSLSKVNSAWNNTTISAACVSGATPLTVDNQFDGAVKFVWFRSERMTATIIDWYTGQANNYGFMISYTDTGFDDYNSIYTNEHATPVNRPLLGIVYSETARQMGHGVYCIRNADTNYYMTYNTNNSVTQQAYTENASSYQKWLVEWIDGTTCVLSTYNYFSATAGYRLRVAGNYDNAALSLSPYLNQSYQKFSITSSADGWLIMPKNSTTRVLEANASSGTTVKLNSQSSTGRQKWYFELCSKQNDYRESESNGTRSVANYIATDYRFDSGSLMIGWIGSASDKDWYKIYAPRHGHLTIFFVEPDGCSYDVNVYEGDSTQEVGKKTSTDYFVTIELVTLRPQSPQTYYIKVEGVGGSMDLMNPYGLLICYSNPRQSLNWVYPLPIANNCITSPVGYRSTQNSYHMGIDLAAAEGTSIKSVCAGVVHKSSYNGTMGNYVIVKANTPDPFVEDGDIYIRYMHMKSRSVEEDDIVSAGDELGKVGITGNSEGFHLHIDANGSDSDDPDKGLTADQYIMFNLTDFYYDTVYEASNKPYLNN